MLYRTSAGPGVTKPDWPDWRHRRLAQVTVLAGDRAGLVPGAASQRARPVISWIRYLTMSRTTSSGSGDAAGEPDRPLGQLEGRQPVAHRVHHPGTEREDAQMLPGSPECEQRLVVVPERGYPVADALPAAWVTARRDHFR